MSPTLYILCGPAGCGKTTWAFDFMQYDSDVRYVSRDAIRFSMISNEEEYFSHEKEVFRRFSDCIAQTLIDGFDVIADATHINEASRHKLTKAIDEYTANYNIIYIVFLVDVETCIERNKNREGLARVPEQVIRDMCLNFKIPTLDEDKRAISVIKERE